MRSIRRVTPLTLCAFAIIAAVGCDALSSTGYDDDRDARELAGSYRWVFQNWTDGKAAGYPLVELSWRLPRDHVDEVFRVYARDARRGGSYQLIATVTSCIDQVCRYDDINVRRGESYDYYIATVEDWDGDEVGTSSAITVDVVTGSGVVAPSGVTAISLDNAAFMRWMGTGAERYMVLSQAETGTIFLIGETDGTSFVDDRAKNGVRYRYYLASVDTHGHVSDLSPSAQAIPRPDFHSEIIYASSDLPTASGFRFVTSEASDPIVAGTASNAQWRLEAVNGVLRIQPLGQTRITAGTFTTALTCGPGSESSCVDVRSAPAESQFGVAAVTAESGNTYVLRVIGDDGRVHYGKVRVQGSSADTQGRRLVVFDWAYQIRADEPTLNVGVG